MHIEQTRLKKKADQKPATTKPPTRLPAKQMIIALITSKNNPKVTTVIGSVKKIKIGFKKAFNKLMTTATITAVPKFLTEIPQSSIKKAASIIANADIINLKSIFKAKNLKQHDIKYKQ